MRMRAGCCFVFMSESRICALCGVPKPEIMNQDIGLKLERKSPQSKTKTMPRDDPQGDEMAKAQLTKYIDSLIFDEEQSETIAHGTKKKT